MATRSLTSFTNAQQYAALDLGSNSFHLLIVNVERGRPRVVETLKEKVQLLSGSRDGKITPKAFERGLACIERYKQRLASVPVENIYLMGTFALRQAENAKDFIEEVGRIIETPLVVISGEYEAELIYQAVAYGFGSKSSETKQLVIDIGGGSTEIALGQLGSVGQAMSVDVGCVALMDAHFTEGQSTGYGAAKQAALKAFEQAGLDVLETQGPNLEVLGTSGTIESVQTVLRANGWSWDTITIEAMDRLEQAIASEQWLVEAGVPGLSPDRIDIFPAGLAILRACFEVLDLKTLTYVDVSLLHGMILEATDTQMMTLLRRERAGESINELAQRFGVDKDQALRVEQTAVMLFRQTGEWFLDQELYEGWLKWASKLHELGLGVNPRHYHRHGAYMLKHADLPGLDEQERNIIALLVRGHRRSLPGLAFQAFDPALANTLLRLVALLRLAVIMERSHNSDSSPTVKVSLDEDRLHLEFEDSWLSRHPLSARELLVEADQLTQAGIQLTFAE